MIRPAHLNREQAIAYRLRERLSLACARCSCTGRQTESDLWRAPTHV